VERLAALELERSFTSRSGQSLELRFDSRWLRWRSSFRARLRLLHDSPRDSFRSAFRVTGSHLFAPRLGALDTFALEVYVASILVVPHAEKDRLAQSAVRGPFGELYLDDDSWVYPVRTLIGAGYFVEWTLRLLERLESFEHIAETFPIEASAGVSHVPKMILAIEVAE
jgi:hypothetical protein